MSIRNLTTQVHQETTEYQRVQQFQSVRSVVPNRPETKQGAAKQTPFLAGAGSRKKTVTEKSANTIAPPPTTAPKIGLKERTSQTTYGIPGGIVARFGREALQKPVTQAENKPTQPEPVPEALPTKEDTAKTNELELAQDTEQERVTEDEATRITIELQSH